MPSPISLSSEHYAVVSAMITPAFFLTATSSLLASSNSRLARVVDRMRVQIAQLEVTAEGSARTRLEGMVQQHQKRARLVLRSLQMLYAAISAFVGTSLAIAIDQFAGFRLQGLPTAFAVLGVILVLVASIYLGREARISVAMLDDELAREIARDKPHAS